ncbi:PREDICTED: uncharacterized protein LOC109231561 [Nicotiana attenuata]|uniref:uncharacterized protein LOC109231561 n=1 Tax=Nicotiana attenuata TaxID=49451 RepID=UPI000904F0F0|nr:PREDICTED: uncharacterized protein LOC109231561 [Nicotiana attenuata]
MGTSAHILPAMDMMVMRKGLTLTQQHQQDLNVEVTEKEIDEALKGIGSDKALGVMFPAINCTTITLLPKIPNPVTIKDFKPIACCTTIISEAQERFIPGRKIADNIILAHELVKAYRRKHISPRCMMKVDMMKAYDSVEWVYLEQLLEYL